MPNEMHLEFEFEFIIPQTAMQLTRTEPLLEGELLSARETSQVDITVKYRISTLFLRLFVCTLMHI